jgi:hypothetical protein
MSYAFTKTLIIPLIREENKKKCMMKSRHFNNANASGRYKSILHVRLLFGNFTSHGNYEAELWLSLAQTK